MEPLDCATCWRTGPKFTIYFSLFLAVSSLIICIVDLAAFGSLGYISSFCGLNLKKTFLDFQFWRLFSTHFVCSSIWMSIFFIMIVFLNSFDLESKFGFRRYILLVSSTTMISTLLACGLGTFFSLVPGINEWSYFAGFWEDRGAVGPTMLCILIAIYEWRVNGEQQVTCCCCFEMKMWVVCLIDIIWCEVSMSYPWNGLWYNLAAIIVGWCVPKKFLVVRAMDTVRFSDDGPAGVQPNGQYQFETINGEQPATAEAGGSNNEQAREVGAKKEKKENSKFGSKGHVL